MIGWVRFAWVPAGLQLKRWEKRQAVCLLRGQVFPRPQGLIVFANHCTVPSLLQEMKRQDPDFPDVSSGVFVYEVIQGTAAAR